MTNCLLDFADCAARLSTENGLLVIEQQPGGRRTIPLNDIAALITSDPRIVLTQNLLAALGRAGAALICCDDKRRPASMLLPVEAHFAQAGRFRAQAAAPLPMKSEYGSSLYVRRYEPRRGRSGYWGENQAG